MSLLRALNPVLAAQQEKLKYERGQGKRDADAWQGVLDSIKPKPDNAGSMYGQEDASGNNVLSTLTQSPVAKQTPAQRLEAQLNAMMLSGNESLQTRALQEIGKAPVNSRSASAKIAVDLGLRPGTPEFNKFVQSHAMKSGTTVSMGGKAGYLTEGEKQQGGLDPKAPFVWGKNGIPQPVKTSGFTENQQKAHGFHERMIGAGKVFNELEDKGFDAATYQQKISNLVPMGFGSKFMTPDQQKYSTAAIDWARSKLRFESGAVIGDQEAADEAKLYFPQPGDSPEVIKIKRKFRKTAERAMQQASGRQPEAEKVWKEGDGPVEGVFWE